LVRLPVALRLCFLAEKSASSKHKLHTIMGVNAEQVGIKQHLPEPVVLQPVTRLKKAC
jgi:hypothetical protein